jgi:O-antigen/teichoic acid export membrane protein
MANNQGTLQNIAKLVTGTGIAQLIQFATIPVLTRIYTPEEFAIFSLFAATATIFSVIATFRYEMAVVLPHEPDDARYLLWVCVYISAAISVLCLVGVLILRCWIGLNPWFFLIPPYVFFSGILQAWNYWSTRNGKFNQNFAGRIGTVMVNSGSSITLGVAGSGAFGLIISSLLAQVTGAFILAWNHIKDFGAFLSFRKPKEMKRVAKNYKKFPLFNTGHALLDTMQDQGMVYFLSHYFLAQIVSFYTQAYRILKAPFGLIGSAIYQVIYPKLSNEYNQQINLRPRVLKIYKTLFLIGLPFFLILWWNTETIFAFFLGNKWIGAGTIAHLILPWLFLNFIAAPLSCLTLIAQKQKQAVIFTGIETCLRFGALIMGGIFNDYKLSFMIINATGCGLMCFALGWYYYISKPTGQYEQQPASAH